MKSRKMYGCLRGYMRLQVFNSAVLRLRVDFTRIREITESRSDQNIRFRNPWGLWELEPNRSASKKYFSLKHIFLFSTIVYATTSKPEIQNPENRNPSVYTELFNSELIRIILARRHILLVYKIMSEFSE